MKKYGKNLLSLLIAIIMLSSIFVSCTKPNDPKDSESVEQTNDGFASADNSQSENGSGSQVTDPVDEHGYIKDNIPDDLKFNGEVLDILACEQQKTQNFAESMNSDQVNDAIYKRQKNVEDRLGITFKWRFESGNYESRDSFVKLVQTDVDGNDVADFDLICAYNLVPPMLAQMGKLKNIADSEYLELDKIWWPSSFVDNIKYNNKLYFVAESCGRGVLRNMMGIFFNKAKLEQYNLEDPYDLVLNYKWTIEKLLEMTESTYSDVDLSNSVTSGDQFGLASATKPYLDSYFFGMGYTTTRITPNGDVEFTLGDAEVSDYVTLMRRVLFGSEDRYHVDPKQYEMFKSNRAVFYHTAVAITDKLIDVDDFEYGVAPMPMKDEAQHEYYTHLSNTYDVWAITTRVANSKMSEAALECIASEAYRVINPAYYESALKLKYASDEVASQVYDIMRNGIVFDLTYMYSCAFSSMPMVDLRNSVSSQSGAWTTAWRINKSKYEKELEGIIDSIK